MPYALDTSGVSNPLNTMPSTMLPYQPIWEFVRKQIKAANILVSIGTYEELQWVSCSVLIDCVRKNKKKIVCDNEDIDQEWKRLLTVYWQYVFGLGSNSKSSISQPDMSVIALAKIKKIPVLSMEQPMANNPHERRIPDICYLEGIEHVDFNDFLRREWPG